MEFASDWRKRLPPALTEEARAFDPDVPFRSSSATVTHPIGLVLVVGSDTAHYRQLLERFPTVSNCVINVTDPLRLPRHVPKEGDTGFEDACASRIANMMAFHPLVAAAIEIFYRTHLVVVHCRRGRHRSVVVGRAVAAFTGARLWCPCIATPYSFAIPPERLWPLLEGRLRTHASRRARVPFPILDFTTVDWTYSRRRVLEHIVQYNTRSAKKWSENDLCMMDTYAGQAVVIAWPTEEAGRWMLGRHTLTYQSGWLATRQLREPGQSPRSLAKLLYQLWTLQPRPLRTRYLRAYQHLPPLRWLTRRAQNMALQTHAGLPVGPLIVRPGEMPDAHSPAFRHPHVLNYAPIIPGCVVVVDLDVERGCPAYDIPPATDDPDLVPVGHYRGGLTLLTVAVAGAAIFVVDAVGRYGWIRARILRHLDEPPGACGSPCPHRYPLLAPVSPG
jgi:hypothetical protein